MGDRKGAEERTIALLLAKIKSKENKRAVTSWVEFLRAGGSNPRTIIKDLYCLTLFLKYATFKTPLEKATKDELASALAKVEGSDYSPSTKRNVKVTLKAFYKHHLGEDLYYPKQVAWVKPSASRGKKMLPEDILSEEEILKMIEAAGSVRDKAIIALLYDSGIRVGELLSLRKKDIDFNEDIAHITVNGKTGMRKIPILFSAPYLSSYLEFVKDKEPDSYLWTGIGRWTKSNKLVDDNAIRKVLRLAAEKARIKKRIYPHLFRHSRATYYANRLTEQQLKAFFGWTGDSKMVSTYVHMSGRDIDDAVLQAYGKKPKEMAAPMLVEKICPRCRYANGIDFLHCQRCGAPLDVSLAMRETKVTGTVKDAMLEMIKDPEFQKDMLSYLQKRRKGKGD